LNDREDETPRVHYAARRLSAQIADIGDVNALSPEKWSDFVNRCEAIISEENTSWAAKWTKA
jgi:hypothetical protein